MAQLIGLAPGEGFPTSVGTGWLIPNAFGTLPAEQIFNILPALLSFELFLPLHRFRPGHVPFRVNTSPRSFIAFRVSTPLIIGIVMLGHTPDNIICVAYIVLRG